MIAFFLALAMVFVPLDDRPVTYQLPLMLGRIAGQPIIAPPRALIGRYLHFGQPDGIVRWLNADAPRTDRYVVSSDMLAYGGLVASRVPGVTYDDAYFRLRELDMLRQRSPHAWIGTFGTIMRLAPTGVPAIGDAASFFAAYPTWQYLQEYANLHDPPSAEEAARAQVLAQKIGTTTLSAYLQARARNYAVDHLLIGMTAAGIIDRLVLGQDDAKPYGLHVPELAALQAYAQQAQTGPRVSIQPGADELGMALVAHGLARAVHWTPHVAVYYSRPDGASYQDPLEFAPVGVTIESLISLCGAVRDDDHPDFTLYVRVPSTGGPLDAKLLADLKERADAGQSIAFTDLSFEKSYDAQGAFAQQLLQSGIASKLDAYSSWNTAANTIGTALAETIAANAGRRSHTYDRLAHQTFTFIRLVDDVDFHVKVRPDLNAWLGGEDIDDHTYLLPDVAAQTAARNREPVMERCAANAAAALPEPPHRSDEHHPAVGPYVRNGTRRQFSAECSLNARGIPLRRAGRYAGRRLVRTGGRRAQRQQRGMSRRVFRYAVKSTVCQQICVVRRSQYDGLFVHERMRADDEFLFNVQAVHGAIAKLLVAKCEHVLRPDKLLECELRCGAERVLAAPGKGLRDKIYTGASRLDCRGRPEPNHVRCGRHKNRHRMRFPACRRLKQLCN